MILKEKGQVHLIDFPPDTESDIHLQLGCFDLLDHVKQLCTKKVDNEFVLELIKVDHTLVTARTKLRYY